MSELQFTKVTNPLIGDNAAMKVWLWDKGPKKPVAPKRPDVPHGKQGDPEFDLATIEFREHLENYETALKAYAQAKKDFAEWEKKNGGPVEIMFWSCDANDALHRDPDRYCVSARTRGYEKLKNSGLPVGVSPGHGHEENLRRQIEGDAEMAAALRRDPVFGKETLQ